MRAHGRLALEWLAVVGIATPFAAPAAPQVPMNPVAQSSNAFGIDLYGQLRATPGNLALSPASISLALAMTWSGAKGDTAAQIQHAVHLSGSPAEVLPAWGQLSTALQSLPASVVLRIANRLFGEKHYRFEQPFLDQARDAFGAPLEALDFRGSPQPARGQINAWIEGQTEGRIRDLIPPAAIDRDTRLVLANALYFLADWRLPFDKAATRPEPFHGTVARDVPTMHQTSSLPFLQRDGLKGLALPYQSERLSMLLVLPDAADGIEALEQSLSAARLDALVQGLVRQRVVVSLPKFEINPSDSIALRDALEKLGVVLAFDRRRADFTGIADPPDPSDRLFVSGVFHKAFVKVDEKGTEAAAATGVAMARTVGLSPAEPVEFKADHPFLFFLRDETSGLVLFMGRVSDPSARP